MKRKLLLIAAIMGTGLLAVHVARTEDAQPPAALHAQLPSLMEKMRVPGLAIAKVENGRIAWIGAYGERAADKPLTPGSVFNVASLTKPVFASAVLHAVSRDALTLDEPLAQFWVDPDVANDARHELLTARIALSHQSGLPNWRGGGKLAFMFEPGARHEYSGEGFEYLRRALERKTGQNLPALLQAHVFEAAGMHDTYAGWHEGIKERAVHGYNEAGEPIDTGLTSRGPNAAANLMTTVGDYARFAAWVAAGADLPPALFDEMRRPQALHADPAERFGLGWKLIPLRSEEALMHDGRESGVRSYAVVMPDAQEALVILTNSSNGELIFRPLIAAALEDGNEVLASTDALVWDYLMHLPPQALVPMSRGIARSPSFLSTLLHSVDTVLIQSSGLTPAEKALAAKRVDEYVFALFNGDINAEQAQTLIERLLEKDGNALRLRTHFDDAAAREWLHALKI